MISGKVRMRLGLDPDGLEGIVTGPEYYTNVGQAVPVDWGFGPEVELVYELEEIE